MAGRFGRFHPGIHLLADAGSRPQPVQSNSLARPVSTPRGFAGTPGALLRGTPVVDCRVDASGPAASFIARALAGGLHLFKIISAAGGATGGPLDPAVGLPQPVGNSVAAGGAAAAADCQCADRRGPNARQRSEYC